jgi:AcrR family transcriptional regulator
MKGSTRASRKPNRPYHHGNLRRALLDEALATIRADGVDGLTLREIGARVGVSRTALYRHFADKRALLAAVATEGFRTLRQQLVTAWEEGGRDLPAFDSMGVAYVRFAVANSSHYRVMFGGFVDPKACDPELAAEASGAFQALVDALAALQRDAIMRGDDTLKMARFVWAVVHGVAMLAIDGQLPETDAVEELMRYSLERLQTGIDAPGRTDRRERPSSHAARRGLKTALYLKENRRPTQAARGAPGLTKRGSS